MIWLSQDQTIVLAGHTQVRVLGLQQDAIRLSVESQSHLRAVNGVCNSGRHPRRHGETKVDASGASVEQSADELTITTRRQLGPAFSLRRVGECAACSESSEPALTFAESN
jgi:hypothetical protein